MKQYIQIECPFCHSDDWVKNGHSETGAQRYRCKTCRKSVQWEYLYRAWLPEVKKPIVEQTLNRSGIRDIRRHLEMYPPARKVMLIQDTLSAHKKSALYELFAPERARAILEQLEFVYTPKHGSWVNVAACELSVVTR